MGNPSRVLSAEGLGGPYTQPLDGEHPATLRRRPKINLEELKASLEGQPDLFDLVQDLDKALLAKLLAHWTAHRIKEHSSKPAEGFDEGNSLLAEVLGTSAAILAGTFAKGKDQAGLVTLVSIEHITSEIKANAVQLAAFSTEVYSQIKKLKKGDSK